MSVQTWDLALVGYSTGVGETLSQAGDTGVAVRQTWDVQYWDGVTWSTGVGNTTSIAVGSVSVENLTWYTIDVTIGSSGAGNTLSQAADGGVTAKNPTAASGAANTLSQADDFAPFTILSPPSVTGFGNTVSSAYGTALRSFNTIGAETEGGFDTNQQLTDSVLVRPSASGDFIIDGLPLPS